MEIAIAIGTLVHDLRGNVVGRVKGLHGHDLLLDRRLARDVYVPFSAVRTVLNGAIILNVPVEKIGEMGWPKPPLF